jgi:hypothetical protein
MALPTWMTNATATPEQSRREHARAAALARGISLTAGPAPQPRTQQPAAQTRLELHRAWAAARGISLA